MPDDMDAASEPVIPAGLSPDELFARAMQSVRMTGGGAHGWEPPEIAKPRAFFPDTK